MSGYKGFWVFKRLYWRFLRMVGFQRHSWDQQYEAGVWCRNPTSRWTLAWVERLCNGGRLVEFGCGEGMLPRELPRKSFADYCGYDISEVAVSRARKFAAEVGLSQVEFKQCNMADWKGSSSVSLVVVEECLNYLDNLETKTFLTHCINSLVPDGKIVVMLHDGIKHARTVSICREVCNIIEEELVEGRTFLVLQKR